VDNVKNILVIVLFLMIFVTSISFVCAENVRGYDLNIPNDFEEVYSNIDFVTDGGKTYYTSFENSDGDYLNITVLRYGDEIITNYEPPEDSDFYPKTIANI
jgi:hypothetical protein